MGAGVTRLLPATSPSHLADKGPQRRHGEDDQIGHGTEDEPQPVTESDLDAVGAAISARPAASTTRVTADEHQWRED